MRNLSIFLLAAAAACAQPASLVATYPFENSLAALQPGAPALLAVNPVTGNAFVSDTVLGQTRTVYQLAGLHLRPGALLNPNSYSIEILFAFTEGPNARRRILDVAERTSDGGLSLNPNKRLELSRLRTGAYAYPSGQYVHLVLTVDANQARLYANGNLDLELDAAAARANRRS